MIKRKSILLLLITILMTTPLAVVVAAEETNDLFKLDAPSNMVITIKFDKELPNVSVITPENEYISAYVFDYNNGADWVEFYIPNAMTGQWRILYDKKTNEKLEITYAKQTTVNSNQDPNAALTTKSNESKTASSQNAVSSNRDPNAPLYTETSSSETTSDPNQSTNDTSVSITNTTELSSVITSDATDQSNINDESTISSLPTADKPKTGDNSIIRAIALIVLLLAIIGWSLIIIVKHKEDDPLN